MLKLIPSIEHHIGSPKLSNLGCGCYCKDNGEEYTAALLDAVEG
jgi:hypothetical protein